MIELEKKTITGGSGGKTRTWVLQKGTSFYTPSL